MRLLDSAFDRFNTRDPMHKSQGGVNPPSLPTKQTLLSVNNLGNYYWICDRSKRSRAQAEGITLDGGLLEAALSPVSSRRVIHIQN